MSKLVFIAVLCAFVAAPVMADPFGHGAGYDGGTANWDRKDGYYAGGGGEFTIWGPDLLLSNSAYANSTSGLAWDTGDSIGGPESFQSFCIETAENIYEPMEIWVSTENIDYSVPGSHAWEGGEFALGGDNLNAETAYFYTQFATGSLNYAYTGTISAGGGNLDRADCAGALQRLIWNIEDEGGYLIANDDYYGIKLTVAQVSLITSWRDEYTTSGWTGIGNVRVLQTYQYNNECYYGLKQDQLYLTPIPGAAILGILGLGVAGLKLRKYT